METDLEKLQRVVKYAMNCIQLESNVELELHRAKTKFNQRKEAAVHLNRADGLNTALAMLKQMLSGLI